MLVGVATKMFGQAKYCHLLCLTAALFLIFGCNDGSEPGIVQPDDAPRNIRMVINGDSAATRDTVLRVTTTGDNLAAMLLSSSPTFNNAEWAPFDSVYFFNSERQEGVFTLFGRFRSLSGAVSPTVRDDITLDFTAFIQSFDVDGIDADTLHPGDQLRFTIRTGEEGRATIGFGDFVNEYPLEYFGNGVFSRNFLIPAGMPTGTAQARANFTDLVGNIAATVQDGRRFTIVGPALNVQIKGELDIPQSDGMEVWRGANACYITDLNRRLHVVSVADPTQPTLVKTLTTPDYTLGIDGKEDIVVVARSSGGIGIYGVTPPENTELLAHLPISGLPKDAVIDGDYAYVATWFSGLHVVDISRPNEPREVSSVRVNLNGYSLKFVDGIVYLAGVGGFAAIRVDSPQEPELLIEQPVEGAPLCVDYCDGFLFLATERQGVIVYDVRNPSVPREAARHPEISHSTALLCQTPFLFVCRSDRFEIYNSTNIRSLPLITSVEGLRQPRGMASFGELMLVAEQGGMTVIDLFSD